MTTLMAVKERSHLRHGCAVATIAVIGVFVLTYAVWWPPPKTVVPEDVVSVRVSGSPAWGGQTRVFECSSRDEAHTALSVVHVWNSRDRIKWWKIPPDKHGEFTLSLGDGSLVTFSYWANSVLRSDGSEFTISPLGQHVLRDALRRSGEKVSDGMGRASTPNSVYGPDAETR